MQIPLAELLRGIGIGIDIKQTELLAGSSDAHIARFAGRIYKAAPHAQARAEVGRLESLRQALGPKAALVVEPVWLVQTGPWWLWSMADVGRTSLDELMAQVALPAASRALVHRIEAVVDKVLCGLDALHKASRAPEDATEFEFAQELCCALTGNLRSAGVESAAAKQLVGRVLELHQPYAASLLHRDLSPINVMVSDDNDAIYLIDPRGGVANLKTQHHFGSIGYDLVGLYIGTLRRQSACVRAGAAVDLTPIVQQLKRALGRCVDNRAMTPSLLALSHVAWWAAYAACRCAFCLSAQREWLYDDAIASLHQSIHRANAIILRAPQHLSL